MSRLRAAADWLGDYAGFLPGIVVALGLTAVLYGIVARRLRITRLLAFLLLMALGVILAATVTPSREAILYGAVGSGTCDLSRIGLAPLDTYLSLNDASLNVALFIPLGLLIGLLPRSPYRLPIAVAMMLLPVAIEATQMVVISLGRGCESADVFNNLAGLFVGLVAGVILGAMGRIVRRS